MEDVPFLTAIELVKNILYNWRETRSVSFWIVFTVSEEAPFLWIQMGVMPAFTAPEISLEAESPT